MMHHTRHEDCYVMQYSEHRDSEGRILENLMPAIVLLLAQIVSFMAVTTLAAYFRRPVVKRWSAIPAQELYTHPVPHFPKDVTFSYNVWYE